MEADAVPDTRLKSRGHAITWQALNPRNVFPSASLLLGQSQRIAEVQASNPTRAMHQSYWQA